ncbi:hypothetical protein IWQ57_005992, partial [Coemansia nantahalensis]
MGEFGAGMYTGAPDMASTPAGAMSLPPIDTAGSLPRQGYFGMAASPGASFDPMSAAAAAAAAVSPSHYMAAAAVAGRGHHPYPPPMMLGRLSLGMGPGAIPTPPPQAPPSAPAQSMVHHSAAGPMIMGAVPSSAGMSVPPTPTRALGLAQMGGHHVAGASSTSQRKRYLCTVCQKMFARPSTLSTHMHSHTGDKPYECTWDGCGKRFSVMSNLRRHQRIHERQRSKFADTQQRQQTGQSPGDAASDAEDTTSGSTTPLVSQLLRTPSGAGPLSAPLSAPPAHHMLPPPPPMLQASSFGHPQPPPPQLAMLHASHPMGSPMD